MEKRIIELTKANESRQCMVCHENNVSIKVKINSLKYDSSIAAFYICDECLAKMQKDIEVCQ